MWNNEKRKPKNDYTGSRSTFEFPSRVNLYGPRLYCIARVIKADTQLCNKDDVVRLYVEFTFTEGLGVRDYNVIHKKYLNVDNQLIIKGKSAYFLLL